MTIDERIEFLKTYINEFEKTSRYGYGYRTDEYLKTCEKIKALEIKLILKILESAKVIISQIHLLTIKVMTMIIIFIGIMAMLVV